MVYYVQIIRKLKHMSLQKCLMYKMARQGFNLSPAEKNIRLGRKKFRWGRIMPEGPNFFSQFDSAPGAEQARGRAVRERGKNI
jgi:hypothetical protein